MPTNSKLSKGLNLEVISLWWRQIRRIYYYVNVETSVTND